MSAPFTPSSIYRSQVCPASTYLPRFERRKADNAPALRGHGFHGFCERAPQVGYEAALAEVPPDAPHRSLCEAVNPLLLPLDWTRVQQEMAFAYDVSTDRARLLPGVRNRSYTLGLSEMGGTVDLAEISELDLTISDIKTGRPSPAYRAQLAAYALGMARALGRSTASVQAIYIDEETQTARIGEQRTFDEFDLAAECASLRRLMTFIAESRRRWEETGVAETNAGEHCRWCDARPGCPEFGGAGRTMERAAPASLAVAFLTRARQEISATDADAARWWLFAERAATMVDELRKSLDDRAREGEPFELGDGRVVRMVEPQAKRTITDGARAEERLSRLGIDASAAFTSQRHTTIGRLTKALGGEKAAEPIVEQLIRDDAGVGLRRGEPKPEAVMAERAPALNIASGRSAKGGAK